MIDGRIQWVECELMGLRGINVWKEIRAADGRQTKKKPEERLKKNNKRKLRRQRKDKNNRVR